MIKGKTFTNCEVGAADDSVAYRRLIGDKVMFGCGVTNSGLNITVAEGYFMAAGRLTQLAGNTTVTVDPVTARYYCVLVYEIDLTQVNTDDEFLQGSFKVLKDSAAYPVPTTGDMDAGDTLYQVPFARWIQSTSGIEDFVDAKPCEIFEKTGTLASMGTSLTISDARIRTDATVEIMTSVFGRTPKAVTLNNGSIVMTFSAKSGAMNVKVRFS